MCKPCDHEKQLEYRFRAMYRRYNPNRTETIKQHGITVKDYFEMLEAQKGKCAICSKEPTKRKLFIDHNHQTKEVRGLLCHHCNAGLGHFLDNVFLLANAIQYLRQYDLNDLTSVETEALPKHQQ